jgi:hypothetical protein
MRCTFVLVTKYYLDYNIEEGYIEEASTHWKRKKFIQTFDEGIWREETSYRLYEKKEESQDKDCK